MYLINGTLLQGGKYKIVRHISSGGFGNTYEALDVALNKRVAIKEFFVKDFCIRQSEATLVTVTAPSKAPLIEHLKRKFIEEARAIASMEHDNIVRVQALFEENGTAYYVMDYVDGESVGDLLKRRGSLPESEAVPIICKVASALDYMHKRNRFHLDVKPANIMLRKDGKVVLIDFGTSKQYAEVDGENTTTMAPCYTPGYAPSEQMNPVRTTFTAATDIYALGATLYKMLTGQTPPSAIDLLNRDKSLSPLPSKVSQRVKDCVQKAMIPQRRERMQIVSEFVSMINGVNVTSPKRSNTGVAVAIVLAIVAIIVCCIMIFSKPGTGTSPGGTSGGSGGVTPPIEKPVPPIQKPQEDPRPIPQEVVQEKVYYRITKNMFVRTGPDTRYEAKYSPYSDFDSNYENGVVVYKGTVIEVIEERGNWVYARQTSENNDRDEWGEGWISKKYMERIRWEE